MKVNYAPSYIDEVFERRDALALHSIICVRSRHSILPDECSLFRRVLEWLGSDWQYYEIISEEDYGEVCRLLEKFGMRDALAAYQEAKVAAPESLVLDHWFERHESMTRELLFHHASQASDFLKRNEG